MHATSRTIGATGETLDALLAEQRIGWALTRPFYTDPALFEIEMERFIAPRWLYAGHISRLPNPGDYFTYQVGQESLLLIRDHSGRIQALFNICRHKGSKLCLEPSGNVKKLVCPYHQWIYETDGTLFQARFMPEEFEPDAFGLRHAHVQVYHGLIFVCLAENPPPFPALKESWIAPYALETAQIAHIASYDVRANWKIVLENFLECYHCAAVHPEYTRVMAGATSTYLSREEMDAQSGRDKAAMQAHLTQLGLDESRPWLPFRQGNGTQSMDGKPVAPLMGTHRDYDGTMLGLWVGWTLEMEANPDHVAAFRFTPLAADRTDVEVHWLIRGDAQEGVDYDLERLITFWKITGEQDWGICEVVQAGVGSRYYQPGMLGRGEHGVKHFLQEYLEAMGRGGREEKN